MPQFCSAAVLFLSATADTPALPYVRFASSVYGQARFALKYRPDPAILQNTCNSAEFVLSVRPFLEQNRLSGVSAGRALIKAFRGSCGTLPSGLPPTGKTLPACVIASDSKLRIFTMISRTLNER